MIAHISGLFAPDVDPPPYTEFTFISCQERAILAQKEGKKNTRNLHRIVGKMIICYNDHFERING